MHARLPSNRDQMLLCESVDADMGNERGESSQRGMGFSTLPAMDPSFAGACQTPRQTALGSQSPMQVGRARPVLCTLQSAIDTRQSGITQQSGRATPTLADSPKERPQNGEGMMSVTRPKDLIGGNPDTLILPSAFNSSSSPLPSGGNTTAYRPFSSGLPFSPLIRTLTYVIRPVSSSS